MLKSGNVFLKQQEAMKIQIVKMDQTAIKQVTQIYQVFQNVISNLSNLSSSDNNMERRFLAQEREKTPSSARVASPASLMTVLPSKPRGLSRKIKLILSLPHYVPEIYRNEALTADMAMEKIRLQFTSAF